MPSDEETFEVLKQLFSKWGPERSPRGTDLTAALNAKAGAAEKALFRLWAHYHATQAGRKGYTSRADAKYDRVLFFDGSDESYEPRLRKGERLDSLPSRYISMVLNEMGKLGYDPSSEDPGKLLDHLLILNLFYYHLVGWLTNELINGRPIMKNMFVLISTFDVSLIKALHATNQMCSEMRESIPKEGLSEGKKKAKSKNLQAVIETFYRSDFDVDEFTSFNALCLGIQERLGGTPSVSTISRFLREEEETEGIREILRKKMLI